MKLSPFSTGFCRATSAWVLSIFACLRISQTKLFGAVTVVIAEIVSDVTVGITEERVNRTGLGAGEMASFAPPGQLEQQKLQLEQASQMIQQSLFPSKHFQVWD